MAAVVGFADGEFHGRTFACDAGRGKGEAGLKMMCAFPGLRRTRVAPSCTLTAMRRCGPKALHKPAQGKRGTSAALGLPWKKDHALKGRHRLPRPFRAWFILA